jgi:thiol:disulfide interchange protein
MRRSIPFIIWSFGALAVAFSAHAQNASELSTATASDRDKAGVELVRSEDEFSSVRIEAARMDSKSGIAAVFEGTEDLHYYARPETAPAPESELQVRAKSDEFAFGEPIFPPWHIFKDPLGKQVDVYAGRFTVFVPIEMATAPAEPTGDIEVRISGIACTSMVCLPFEKTLQTKIDWSNRQSWKQISRQTPAAAKPAGKRPAQPIWLALSLAFLAGLALNIMPCVWPVLPLIVMRIVGQAKQSKGASAALGLVFCLGILLFFAALAGANIILQVVYGTVLQWGDQFRNPTFVAGMALLLILLALFMFGVFTISVPSSIAGKAGSGKGYLGAVGMGFLAAILSTPCSFGILAAAFAWAQSQPLLPATVAMLTIGLGMAAPYAVLTSMPSLLGRLPRSGRWMELFKQAVGFLLLIIAVKLLVALPEARKASVLYFAVVLAFCVWMWGSWVSYTTKRWRKWLVRGAAALLAVTTGWALVPAPAYGLIDWKPYDALAVDKAIEEGRPVLIEFTADWCLSCQTVEKLVYSRRNIADLIRQKGVLAMKADTTEYDSPATLALKHAYNEPGVPVSMLFVPGNKEPISWRGMLFATELKEHLEQLPQRTQNGEEVQGKSESEQGRGR